MFWTQKFSFSVDPVILDLKLQLAESTVRMSDFIKRMFAFSLEKNKRY